MYDLHLDRPAFSLTIGELINVLKVELKPDQITQIETTELPKKIRGIHGLAEFLGISPVTAQKLKNSGKIPYSQYGRVILFDGNAVLKAMSEINQAKKRGRHA